MKHACPSCGAVAADDATRCDLCGTPLASEGASAEQAPAIAMGPTADAPAPPASPVAAAPASYCIACGHANPLHARFCNACGMALPPRDAALPPLAPPPPATTPVAVETMARPVRPAPDGRPERRALALVGVGVAAVVGLYGVTVLSKDSDPLPAEVPAGAPVVGAAPGGSLPVSATDMVPVEVDPASVSAAGLPDSLRPAVEAATAAAVNVQAAPTAAAWAGAGGLYMDLLVRTPEAQRGPVARQAIAAFQQSLTLEENADVRVSMAWAYRYDPDPSNTMQAVAQLLAVLGADSDHVRANFYLGVLRAQIGRVDGAVEQFERVVSLTDHEDPFHQAAARELAALEDATGAPAAAPAAPLPGG